MHQHRAQGENDAICAQPKMSRKMCASQGKQTYLVPVRIHGRPPNAFSKIRGARKRKQSKNVVWRAAIVMVQGWALAAGWLRSTHIGLKRDWRTRSRTHSVTQCSPNGPLHMTGDKGAVHQTTFKPHYSNPYDEMWKI